LFREAISLEVNEERLKLNGTHQLLVYADDVILLKDNRCALEKN
jgi:hypothetical protein